MSKHLRPSSNVGFMLTDLQRRTLLERLEALPRPSVIEAHCIRFIKDYQALRGNVRDARSSIYNHGRGYLKNDKLAIEMANYALNALTRIPDDDPLAVEVEDQVSA